MVSRIEAIERAKDAAVKSLARTDKTRQELTEWLVSRGHDEAVVERALLELEAAGVVDDARVAAEFVRKKAEAGAAASLIEMELLERGISAAIVARALADTAELRNGPAEALELARDRVRRSRPGLDPQVVVRRAFELLRRKGYDDDTAQSAARRATEEYLGPGSLAGIDEG